MAVFCKSKLSKEYQLTDYLFDTDCKQSFSKGNKLAFIGDCCFTYSEDFDVITDKKGEHVTKWVNSPYGTVMVKVDGLYGIIHIRTDIDPKFCKWRMVFEPQFDSMTTIGTYIQGGKYGNAWLAVTRPGNPRKGLLKISASTGTVQYSTEKAKLLECEYDEIMPADNGKALFDSAKGYTYFISTSEAPSFVYRKGDRWGTVADGYNVIPALYDAASFSHTGRLNRHSSMKTPYLVRKLGAAYLLERNDTTFACDRSKYIPLRCAPGEIPGFQRFEIPDYWGNFSKVPYYFYGEKDDFAVYVPSKGHFIPHRGSTKTVSPWRVFAADSISTYLIKGDGYSLYNAATGRDLITDADTITPASDGFFAVTRRGAMMTKKAFVTRDYAEAVTFEDFSELPLLAQTARTVGTTRILDYKGSAGLYDEASGYALPCYFDSIVPLSEVVDSIPVAVGRLFITYKNGKIGITGSSASVTGMAFDKISRSPDRRGVILKGRIYNSRDPYTLWITSDDGQNLTLDDNLDKLLDDLVSNGIKEAKKSRSYTGKIDYLLTGMFEFADKFGKPEILPRIYRSGAVIALNVAVSNNEKSYAMKWLDKADQLNARAQALSDTWLSDLDLPGIRERMNAYFRQQEIARAEAEEARQREMERQAQAQAEAAEMQRQQRAEAWAQLANALTGLSQNINTAVGQYNASKRTSGSSSGRTRPSQSYTSSSARSSSTTKSSSSTSATKAKTPNFGNRKALETAYETAKQSVMNYYYGKYTWNLSEVRARQQSMRDTRALAQKQGFTIYKSDFEDVSEPYRK